MSVRKPSESSWRRIALLLKALSLIGCSDDEESRHGRAPTSPAANGGYASLSPGGSTGFGASSTAASGGRAGDGGEAGRNASGGRDSSGGIGTGDGGRPPALRCSGKPGALRGKSDQMLSAGGLSRTFTYYAPSNLNPNEPAPVVIVAHGYLQSGQAMYDLTRYQSIADREGFVVMYPDGQPAAAGPWNVGVGACPSTLLLLPTATGDDQAFIDAMLDFADNDQCVDREHVFVTGFSMGGYFANETGCLRSNIAAIAPHSGGSHELTACPVVHKPVILFHGISDGLIPVGCGTEARERWVMHNGCSAEVESVPVTGGHCEYSKGCPANGQVALCLFDGMDHGWAGGQGSYGFPNYESASELGWAFFQKYAW